MHVVVDASALGAMNFGEPEGPAIAQYLEGDTLLAPALVDYELANLASVKVRRGTVAPAEAALLLATALQLNIQRVAVPCDEVFILSRETGLSAYDAAYLWLARTSDSELITLDRELAQITDALGGPGASYRTG
jgi:predicted nucleic acid-binding protein